MNMRLRVFGTALLGLLVIAMGPRSAAAQGTAFTYQGLVRTAGAPTAGPVDLRFRLYDALTLGSQQGPTLNFTNVALDGGTFTLQLDFGLAALVANTPRWMQIDVAPAGSGLYTALSPRQPLSPTPFAINTRGIVVDDQSRVGIKTTSPDDTLDVQGTFHAGGAQIDDAQNLIATDQRASSSNWQSFTALTTGELRRVTFRGTSASAFVGSFRVYEGEGTGGTPLTNNLGIVGAGGGGLQTFNISVPAGVGVVAGQKYTFSTATPATFNYSLGTTNPYAGGISGSGPQLDLYFETMVAPVGLVVTDQGRVGAGTTAPTEALDVRGNVKMGPAGTVFAAGGEENLRIVRGTTNSLPAVAAGSGFSVVSLGGANYLVTFTTPFSATPTVTVSATSNRLVGIQSVSTFSFTVSLPDANGNSFPSGFHFIAVGPR